MTSYRMTARRSLTVQLHQLAVKSTIPVSWVLESDVIHLFTMTLLPFLTPIFAFSIQTGVSKLPVRQADITGKAGQAELRLVFEQLAIKVEGLLDAQRPRAFFAI